MNTHDAELVRALYQPSAVSLASNLPDMGESLNTSCCEVARNPSLEKCDALASRLQAAGHAVSRLRQALLHKVSQ